MYLLHSVFDISEHFSAKFVASAEKDAEVCETAKAEIAELKTQLKELENDVSHWHVPAFS